MEAEGTAPEVSEAARAAKQTPAPEAKRRDTRKRSITIFIVVSLINVGLLAFLWAQLLTPAQNASQNPGQANASDPLIGHPAPDFTLAVLGPHGAATLTLSSFKGKPVMLNVWNSTCGPCVDEAPLLEKQWQQVKAQGVVFIGIDFQDTKSDGLSFLQKYGITYPNVLDMTGSIAINYGVTGTPESIFINRQGIVVSRVAYELTAQTLQRNLQLITR